MAELSRQPFTQRFRRRVLLPGAAILMLTAVLCGGAILMAGRSTDDLSDCARAETAGHQLHEFGTCSDETRVGGRAGWRTHVSCSSSMAPGSAPSTAWCSTADARRHADRDRRKQTVPGNLDSKIRNSRFVAG